MEKINLVKNNDRFPGKHGIKPALHHIDVVTSAVLD
jgi:hypothetical protein